MRRIKQTKPSAALIVAVVALVAALGGGAVAGVAVTSLGKKETKKVRKIARKQAGKLDKKIELTPGPKGDTGPVGPTEGTAADGVSGPLTPEVTGDQDDFTTTQAGRLLVIKPVSRRSTICSAGTPWRMWLKVDGVRVPGSVIVGLPSGVAQHAFTLSGVTSDPVAAGSHTAGVGIDCPTGDFISGAGNSSSGVSAVVLGG